MLLRDIRQSFLQFFQDNGHMIEPSAPLVPYNDPTLLFTNAGMVPFKNIFTGLETPKAPRVTTCQKCVRAGGKHNDLENVGHTARHHTFFEMLGNFSFGDYFKEEAISLAWQLIHDIFAIPQDRLLITVHSSDEEAATLWHKIAGFPDKQIIRIPTSDNFWSMGTVGPCGPCSEIFFDHGPEIPGGPPGSDNDEGDRFVEIWNLVFMQFEQMDTETRTPLPKPSIDTGMGLERITAVLQGKHDNFNIDLFQTIMQVSADLTDQSIDNVSHRVIADHLRASSFLIADGVLPSNEGRGYVLRRIMRRAMRHAYQLGTKEALMYRLVPTLIQEMGQAYDELIRAESLITTTLQIEEEKFRQTLGRGLKILAEETRKLKSNEVFPGDIAFKLYDTYGFPFDLTQDVLRNQQIQVDLKRFNEAMEQQRQEARQSWAGSGETATETIWLDLRQKIGASEFLGYAQTQGEAIIQAIITDGTQTNEAKEGQAIQLITNQTPFYAESGGQQGDSGHAETSQGATITIDNTLKKAGDLHVHYGHVTKGIVKEGDTIKLSIDEERRARLRRSHSATHLLHKTLRHILGTHVIQKGSLVAPDRLRFDFSHPKALIQKELKAIEAEVNSRIRLNGPVETRLMNPDEAIKQGAMALFGEKYGDEVRIVSMGFDPINKEEQFSVEFCGGTHVSRTGDIGYFKIVSESSVSSGIRRIEALTGEEATQSAWQETACLEDVARLLKTTPKDVAHKIQALINEKKHTEKALKEAQFTKPSSGQTKLTETIEGIQVWIEHWQDRSTKELKPYADQIRGQLPSGVIILTTTDSNRVSLVVSVSHDLTKIINAVDLVRLGSEILGGKGGGGRPDMAQGGGVDAKALPKMVEELKKALKKQGMAA